MNKTVSKIFYFDRETIQNTLQEYNKGHKETQTNRKNQFKSESALETRSEIGFSIPFFQRLKFLVSGRIKIEHLLQKDSQKTITSTELSEFNSIENNYTKFSNVKIKDIENSSTFF